MFRLYSYCGFEAGPTPDGSVVVNDHYHLIDKQSPGRIYCDICKGFGRSVTYNYLYAKDAVEFEGALFSIPQEHTHCRDLFNLNPLGYLHGTLE